MPGGEDRWKDGIESRLDDHETKLDNLMAWRSWVIGAVAGIGMVLGAFAKQIADLLRHL